jgi:hypothetical protein
MNSSSLEITATEKYEDLKEIKVDVIEETKEYEGYEVLKPENAPVTLTWRNLTVRCKYNKKPEEDKPLINNVSGSICGGFWAVLGASVRSSFILVTLLIF